MKSLLSKFYSGLMFLACISMVAAFGAIMLGVIAREARLDIQGLDGYAGYSIAAALFLALPDTLRHGDHIRVTLLLQKLGQAGRNVLEYWSLASALALSGYLAWFACRLVWVSYTTHDVSPAADASPLWIPQLSMALGCIGLVVAFADAFIARMQGVAFFAESGGANVE